MKVLEVEVNVLLVVLLVMVVEGDVVVLLVAIVGRFLGN